MCDSRQLAVEWKVSFKPTVGLFAVGFFSSSFFSPLLSFPYFSHFFSPPFLSLFLSSFRFIPFMLGSATSMLKHFSSQQLFVKGC